MPRVSPLLPSIVPANAGCVASGRSRPEDLDRAAREPTQTTLNPGSRTLLAGHRRHAGGKLDPGRGLLFDPVLPHPPGHRAAMRSLGAEEGHENSGDVPDRHPASPGHHAGRHVGAVGPRAYCPILTPGSAHSYWIGLVTVCPGMFASR